MTKNLLELEYLELCKKLQKRALWLTLSSIPYMMDDEYITLKTQEVELLHKMGKSAKAGKCQSTLDGWNKVKSNG